MTLTDDPKKNPGGEGIPPFLQVQNRPVLTVEQRARVDAWLARPVSPSAESRTGQDDAAAAALRAELRVKKEESFKSRTAAAKARVAREGRYVPGCTWDAAAGRFVHPTSAWDGRKWVPKKSEGAAGAGPVAGETTMAKKAKAKKASPKEKNGAGRDVKRAPGLVGDFGQVREGTARATVVKMGVRGATVEAVAKAIGKERGTVMTHLFCLNRDCAYGYEVAEGKLTITFPGSKTLEDAIKPPAAAA